MPQGMEQRSRARARARACVCVCVYYKVSHSLIADCKVDTYFPARALFLRRLELSDTSKTFTEGAIKTDSAVWLEAILAGSLMFAVRTGDLSWNADNLGARGEIK